MKEIKFYKVSDSFGFFSNFAPFPIFIKGERWSTVEHYFQASKFEDIKIKEKIKLMDSPMNAALEGRKPNNVIKIDWDFIKEDIMYEGLWAKFTQHPTLMMKLLETNELPLIEHTENDSYWGDGGDGFGKNRLGFLLMKLRSDLKIITQNEFAILPPWIAFPGISKNDLFWRMGFGETYLYNWIMYFNNINQSQYKEVFPENEEWEGFYKD